MGQAGGSCGRWLRAAPLAGAAATQDEGGRVAFLADTRLSRPAALQVAGRAAEKALHKFVKEVAREQHVDPGVAAAVEAGQEHGDDEGRSCRVGREERRTRGHSGTIADLPDSATVVPAIAISGTRGWITRQSTKQVQYVLPQPCSGPIP